MVQFYQAFNAWSIHVKIVYSINDQEGCPYSKYVAKSCTHQHMASCIEILECCRQKSFEPDKISTMVDGGLVAEDTEERGYVVVEQKELSESWDKE